MAASDGDAARLIERLAVDPEFRARFRQDPGGAAREAGLDGLADDLVFDSGDPMQTLELRESKSSMAGALVAAAVEGIAIYELGSHFLQPDVAEAATGARSPPVDVHEVHGPGARWDPDQFGQNGAGGPPSAATLAVLENPNVSFDPDGIDDLKAGRIDPRVVDVLTEIAKKHRIVVSAMCSDHDRLTAGGSVSNHYYGRAVDIASVDGQLVSPGNAAARQIAVSLARFLPSIRPTEIGSPWALSGAAYFSDAEHQNHLHIAFDDPISPGWQPVDASEAGAAPGALSSDPDDWDGNLDDEDAGDDEEDGSNEDESDEEGGEDDDGGDEDGEDEDDDEDWDPADENSPEDSDDNDTDSDDDDSSDGDSSDSDSQDEDAADGDVPDLPDALAYPGDDAPQEQVAAWMAVEAQKRGLPPELPVMAALVESSLRNLDYGDADSVGFFQMRTSIWNQGGYAGYADRPGLQLKWFLDQAEAVKAQRVSRGLAVDDPGQYGEWIADVERPAEQYRGRYQLRLAEARSLLEQARGAARVLKVVSPGG